MVIQNSGSQAVLCCVLSVDRCCCGFRCAAAKCSVILPCLGRYRGGGTSHGLRSLVRALSLHLYRAYWWLHWFLWYTASFILRSRLQK